MKTIEPINLEGMDITEGEAKKLHDIIEKFANDRNSKNRFSEWFIDFSEGEISVPSSKKDALYWIVRDFMSFCSSQ